MLVPGIVVQIFNSSTWEAKAGGFISWVLGQPGLPQKGKQTNKQTQKNNQPTKNPKNLRHLQNQTPSPLPPHPSSKNPMPPSGLCIRCSQAFTSDDSCLIVQRLQERTVFSLGMANARGGRCARPRAKHHALSMDREDTEASMGTLRSKGNSNSQTPKAVQVSRNDMSSMWTTGGFLVVRYKPAFLRNLWGQFPSNKRSHFSLAEGTHGYL